MTDKLNLRSTSKLARYNGSAPNLFEVFLGDYCDEMEKMRDKKNFQKMQSIKKELQHAKEYLENISEKHLLRMNNCRKLLEISRNTINRVFTNGST